MAQVSAAAAVVDLQEFRRKRELARERTSEATPPAPVPMVLCGVPITYWPMG